MERHSITSWIARAACVLVSIAAGVHSAYADSGIYRRALSGTVLVLSENSVGTGVLIDQQNRLVVTCNHVVGQANEVVTFFPMFANGKVVSEQSAYAAQKEKHALKASVVMRDPRNDLALLRLERLPETVQAVPLATSDPEPGDEVHTIGNSGVDSAALWRYSMGTVRQSYFKRLYQDDIWVETNVLETQIPVNEGDSGGPILNSNGELVALNMATAGTQSLVSLGIDVRAIQTMLVRHYLELAKARQQVTELFLSSHPSAESGEESDILITNQLNQPFSLIWVDHNSELHDYGVVSTGQTLQICSFVGHVWLIRLSDGTDAGYFESTPRGTSVVVNADLLNTVKHEVTATPAEGAKIEAVAAADPVVQTTMTGHIWNTSIQTAADQAISGYWLTQFNADGTFVELTVNTDNVVMDQRTGHYVVNADVVTMTSGESIHWIGRIFVHDQDSISFVFADGRTLRSRPATPVFSKMETTEKTSIGRTTHTSEGNGGPRHLCSGR